MPTAAEVNGNFAGVLNSSSQAVVVTDPLNNHNPFPGNIIPSNRQNPSGQALPQLLNTIDPPNIGNQVSYNYRGTLPVLPSFIWNNICHYDWNVSQKHRLSVHSLHLSAES